jgi:hypothetical protein
VDFPGGFGARGPADGAARGRRIDTEFQRSITLGSRGPDALRIHAALHELDIVAVKVQQRVSTTENKLTTLLDGVGVTRGCKSEVWCIEIKSCRLPVDRYMRYATSACSRTPLLRTTPALPNNEKTRHSIQCGYGALGLSRLIKRPVKGVVVVVCSDGVITYKVESKFMADTLFFRRTRIPRRVPAAVQTKTARKKNKTNVLERWIKPADEAMKFIKLKRGKRIAKSIHGLVSPNGDVVGVVAYSSTWGSLSVAARETASLQLRVAARRTAKTKNHSVAPYVLAALTPNGRLQLALAGVPIAGGNV